MTLVPCQRQKILSTRGGKGHDTIPPRGCLTKHDEGDHGRENDEPEVRQQKHDASSAKSSAELRKMRTNQQVEGEDIGFDECRCRPSEVMCVPSDLGTPQRRSRRTKMSDLQRQRRYDAPRSGPTRVGERGEGGQAGDASTRSRCYEDPSGLPVVDDDPRGRGNDSIAIVWRLLPA